MAQYTVLNIEQATKALKPFGISNVNEFKILSGGSENTNYLIITNTNKLVLTICEQKTAQEATNLVSLLEHLAVYGLKTSRPIRTLENEPITYWNKKPVILKEYIEGSIVKDLTAVQLKKLGKQLGTLHEIPPVDYLPGVISFGIESFDEIKKYAEHSDFHYWLEDIKVYITPYLLSELQRAITHSDLFYNNVIVSDNLEVTLMDFEEATMYYKVFDIGMTIVGVCHENDEIDLKKAGVLVKGYTEEILLTQEEKKSLKAFTVYAAAATAFWRHKQYHFINPDPGFHSHYLQMKKIADYVRGIPDTCFYELVIE